MSDAKQPRLGSLDALRGFDMFWIIGGGSFLVALAKAKSWRFLQLLAAQQEHAAWNGFRFEDLIFPLFLFIAGASVPFSLERDLERGATRASVHLRILRRGVLLVLLGLVYQGILQFRWAEMRYCSVLGRIGLAWMLAALLAVNCRPRRQALGAAAILLGYWALMTLVPVPGHGPGVLTPEGNLAAFVDRHLLPGKFYLGVHDPEGLVGTLPAVATALMGILAGRHLRTSPGPRAALALALAGLAALGFGWAWHPFFPVNKNLWSSSFVLVAGGWSLLLLALFHFVVDVRGWTRWCRPFVLIGLNPITIYLAQEGIVSFPAAARYFVGGLCRLLPGAWPLVGLIAGIILMKLLFLWFLDRHKVYLRV